MSTRVVSAVINYYDVLGVSRNCGDDEVRQAYHRLALEFHPDKNPSPSADERMRQINEAYRILSDPALRADYDARIQFDGGTYARWYRHGARGYGESPSAWPHPGAGYEAPRTSVAFESVTLFSFGHLAAAAAIGLACGIAITAALVFFGVDPGHRLADLALSTAAAVALPPLLVVMLMRTALSSRSEAGMCGAIALAFALPMATMAGLYTGTSDLPACACCLLPFACVVVGWIIGGFVGRAAWSILHG